SISAGERRKSFGSQLSNFFDNSRMARSFFSSTCARMLSTVSRTLASAALIALASIPRLRKRAMGTLLDLRGAAAAFCSGTHTFRVMAGHSRPKDGVAMLAYAPAIHDELRQVETRHGPPGQAQG